MMLFLKHLVLSDIKRIPAEGFLYFPRSVVDPRLQIWVKWWGYVAGYRHSKTPFHWTAGIWMQAQQFKRSSMSMWLRAPVSVMQETIWNLHKGSRLARTHSIFFLLSLSLSLPFIMFAQAHIIPCISILLWYFHKHSHAQWKVTEVGLSWSAWAQISFRGFKEQSQTEPLRKTLQSTDVHELLSIRFLSLSFILFYILIVVTWTYTFFKSK